MIIEIVGDIKIFIETNYKLSDDYSKICQGIN